MIKGNEDLVRKEIVSRLDKRFLDDLKQLMNTPEGRRIFSYMQMHCGFRESLPMGNSRDMFNAGRRAVAVELLHAVEAIGHEDPLEGLKLRQQAEQEYFMYQWRLRESIRHRLEEESVQRRR
jgi:hypothetical protein